MDTVKVNVGFDVFPAKCISEGDNRSPKVTIEGAKGVSMALIMDDPDAPRGTWVHWLIWNMVPADHIPEGVPREGVVTTPIKAVQGTNTGGEIGYDGPCPPRGHGPHRYFFKIYILDRMLDLKVGANKRELEKAMEGHIIQKGETMATFERR